MRGSWPGRLASGYRVLRANPLTLAGFVLVGIFVGAAAVIGGYHLLTGLAGRASWPLPYDPSAVGSDVRAGPSAAHWFGTDELGRDMFSRVMAALPFDLLIAILITATALVIGGGLGLVAGFWDRPGTPGGWLSAVVLRVTDVFLAFPSLVLALALAAALGRTVEAAVLAVLLTWWPYYVRLVRGEVLAVKPMGFVQAARAAGVREGRILWRHVVRNILEPILVYYTMDIGTVLVVFSTISFVGLSIPATSPQPEWGSMTEFYQPLLRTAPWTVLAPGLALVATVLAFSLLGDGLRDFLDPRTRRAMGDAPVAGGRGSEP